MPEKNWNPVPGCTSDVLTEPLRWRKPRTVPVCPKGDLYGEGVPFEFTDKVKAVEALCRQHLFLESTKRPERMAEYNDVTTDNREHAIGHQMRRLTSGGDAGLPELPLPNAWLGTSCEDQATAAERIPHLLKCPAVVRFLSLEPLLGKVDLVPNLFIPDPRGSPVDLLPRNPSTFDPAIGWVIVGGESGPGARPMNSDWVCSIRDQCVAAGVAFFFKQWGEWAPTAIIGFGGHERKPTHCFSRGDGYATEMIRVGKKAAGRLLDGRVWDERPEG